MLERRTSAGVLSGKNVFRVESDSVGLSENSEVKSVEGKVEEGGGRVMWWETESGLLDGCMQVSFSCF